MNRFFRRLPLRAKLMLIGFLPLLFLIFLTFSLYVEKNQNITILERYLDKFEESAHITHLIDNLQIERKFSYDYVLKNSRKREMLAQRIKTDSLIDKLNAISDSTLQGFENYSFLVDMENSRSAIDSGMIAPNGVMHIYSAAIFRLNTLNGISSGNNSYLRAIYSDMTSQKLLSEMITYLGLINANIYNILYTREYVTETLMGTWPSYEVYQSYEKEFFKKASPEVTDRYKSIRYNSSLDENIKKLEEIFGTFVVDSAYTFQTWDNLTSKGINDLRLLQMDLLEDVQQRLRSSYSDEAYAKWRTLVILVIALVLVIIMVSYTVHVLNSMLNELKYNALKISKGEPIESFHDVPDDVIGSLSKSISEIDKSNKQLAEAANAIGYGNFNVNLEPRSTQDLLGNALLKMKQNLQASIKETEESREEFRKLADFVPQIVWTAGSEGYVDYYNKKWYEYTGAPLHFGDDSFLNQMHPDDAPLCRKKWYNSVKTGDSYELEVRFRNIEGNYRWFLSRAVAVRNANGIIQKWFGTCTDINDRKNRSEQLESLVQQRTRELERSNDDLRQFAHVASHDLKEPIRKIRMFSSRLKDDYASSIPDEGKTYIEKIQEAAKRMATMVDGVLNYSVTTSSENHFEWIDLNEIMEDIRQDLELVIQQKNATLQFSKLPRVYGIRVLLYQLFYNLVNNSLKFSKKGYANNISVSVNKVKGFEVNGSANLIPGKEYISIEINDEGIGFDPDNAEKMFQLFSRLNPKDKYEGTGLGLALCKKIALRHNGNITAHGKENEGARFTVYLPTEK